MKERSDRTRQKVGERAARGLNVKKRRTNPFSLLPRAHAAARGRAGQGEEACSGNERVVRNRKTYISTEET